MAYAQIVVLEMSSVCDSDTFFKALNGFFEEHGYELYPVLNQFRKYREGGFTNVIFSNTQYADRLVVECTFGCRINLVEETVMPFSNGVNGYKEESNTTVTNLANYLGKPGFKLRVENTSSLEESVCFVKTFFETEGFEFLEKMTSVRQVEAFFNANPTGNSMYSFNHQLRAFRGITLATIAQNPRWEELRKEYLQLLSKYGTPPIIIDKFNRLCSHLARISLN